MVDHQNISAKWSNRDQLWIKSRKLRVHAFATLHHITPSNTNAMPCLRKFTTSPKSNRNANSAGKDTRKSKINSQIFGSFWLQNPHRTEIWPDFEHQRSMFITHFRQFSRTSCEPTTNYHCSPNYNQLTGWCPNSWTQSWGAHNSKFTRVYGKYIELDTMVYKQQTSLGGHQLVDMYIIFLLMLIMTI